MEEEERKENVKVEVYRREESATNYLSHRNREIGKNSKAIAVIEGWVH